MGGGLCRRKGLLALRGRLLRVGRDSWRRRRLHGGEGIDGLLDVLSYGRVEAFIVGHPLIVAERHWKLAQAVV